jgi:hypothetical protein
LAIVPYLLGFHPSRSLVVIGLGPSRHQVKLAFRYDLPDPPDSQLARDIGAHAASVLTRQQLTDAVAIGYGPGSLVTPVADMLLDQLPAAGIEVWKSCALRRAATGPTYAPIPRAAPPTAFGSMRPRTQLRWR